METNIIDMKPNPNKSNPAVIDGKAELVSRGDAEGMERKMSMVEGSTIAVRAQAISIAFREASFQVSSAIRKVIYCGLLMIEQKEECKHGQFEKWLEKNCPEIPFRTARHWMEAAEAGVCLATGEKSINQIGQNGRFDASMPISKILQLPSTELSKENKALQGKIFDVVDGKTQSQLVFDFRSTKGPGGKTTKYDSNGNPIHKAYGKLPPEQMKHNANEGVKLLSRQILSMACTKTAWLSLCDRENFRALEEARILLGQEMKKVNFDK